MVSTVLSSYSFAFLAAAWMVVPASPASTKMRRQIWRCLPFGGREGWATKVKTRLPSGWRFGCSVAVVVTSASTFGVSATTWAVLAIVVLLHDDGLSSI